MNLYKMKPKYILIKNLPKIVIKIQKNIKLTKKLVSLEKILKK